MNFTDSALRESRQEFSYEEQCEVFINPRYYGNQCPDNLSGLKLKVHHVLNVRLAIRLFQDSLFLGFRSFSGVGWSFFNEKHKFTRSDFGI